MENTSCFTKMVDCTSALLVEPTVPNFAVLVDPTPEQINAVAESCPDLFVFSFLTKPVGLGFVAKLNKSPFIALPVYISSVNSEGHKAVINQYVARILSQQ